MKSFNDRLAVLITNGVSTMWCAYAFAGLALWGGTAVDWGNSLQVVQWLSQTFLQLVLLSIIMVGQKILSQASDTQAREMHDAVMEELALARQEVSELRTIHEELRVLLNSSQSKT